MSEQAERERVVRRSWAAPGSSHDHVVRLLKIALPSAVGVILAFLALAPLEEKQEVSFLLDKNKVDHAEERMRIESAQYRGQDEKGRPFVLNARSALQHSSADPVVDIRTMRAEILLDDGPARLFADQARYFMEEDKVTVAGPILFTARDGYRLQTRDVTVDLRDRTLQSRGAVNGQMPLGRFTADRLQVDLPERRAVLTGRARVHIVQGAIG